VKGKDRRKKRGKNVRVSILEQDILTSLKQKQKQKLRIQQPNNDLRWMEDGFLLALDLGRDGVWSISFIRRREGAVNLPTQGPHHRPVGLRVLARILDWDYGVSWSLGWIDLEMVHGHSNNSFKFK
jgi:hypothetical protein